MAYIYTQSPVSKGTFLLPFLNLKELAQGKAREKNEGAGEEGAGEEGVGEEGAGKGGGGVEDGESKTALTCMRSSLLWE